MKKTSLPFRLREQEMKYAKQYIKSNARLLLVVLICLILLVSGMLLPEMVLNFGFSLLNMGYYTSNLNLFMLCVCILAFLLPFYQFRFIMKRSSSDLYLSLPIKRERLFYLQYLIGAFLLFGISFIVGIFNLFSYSDIRNYGYLRSIGFMIILVFLALLLYTFFTFLVTKCRTMLDAILTCILYTILPILFHWALQYFLSEAASDVLLAVFSSGPEFEFNAISQYCTALLSLPWLMSRWTYLFSGELDLPLFCLLLYTILWICFATACFVWAKKSFVLLKSEDSEQPTHSLLTYPILIPIAAFLFLMCFGKGSFFSFSIVSIFVFYLVAFFLAQRKIKLTWGMLASFLCCVLLSSSCYRLMVSTNLFQYVQEIPEDTRIYGGSIQVNYQKGQRYDGGGYSEISKLQYTGNFYQNKITNLKQMQEAILPLTSKENVRFGEYQINYIRVTFDYLYNRSDTQDLQYGVPISHREYNIVGETNIKRFQQLCNTWLADGLVKNEEVEE